MKKLMVMVGLLVLVGLVGCITISQADMNSVAQGVGVAAVTAYNTNGDKLTPQEKQAAQIAISAIGAISKTVTDGNVNNVQGLVNDYIKAQIKDPKQASMAQGVATLFLSAIAPSINNQIAKNQNAVAVQLFMSFCDGVASVPLTKLMVK